MEAFEQVDKLIRQGLEQGAYPAAALAIGIGDQVYLKKTYGSCDENTIFDMASLTKVISPTIVAFRFLEDGLLRLYDNLEDFFPDVPTALESGYEVIDNQLRGFIVHKSVSDDVVAALEGIFEQVAANPEFVQACADLGKGVRFMGAAEYAEFLATENALYEDLIKTNGLGDKY